MDDATRRKIAFAVAAKAGVRPSSVYSHDAGSHTHMSGGGNSMYDFGSGSHFSESYDYSRGAHWNLEVSQGTFSGFDHGFGHHFSGTISGRNISVYDYGAGQHYNYTV
jgi:hypothetical protein